MSAMAPSAGAGRAAPPQAPPTGGGNYNHHHHYDSSLDYDDGSMPSQAAAVTGQPGGPVGGGHSGSMPRPKARPGPYGAAGSDPRGMAPPQQQGSGGGYGGGGGGYGRGGGGSMYYSDDQSYGGGGTASEYGYSDDQYYSDTPAGGVSGGPMPTNTGQQQGYPMQQQQGGPYPQVWSLTQFRSVDFSLSTIDVNK